MTDDRTPNDEPTQPFEPPRDGASDGASADTPTERFDVTGAAEGDAPTQQYEAVDAGDAPTRAFTRPFEQPAAMPPAASAPPPTAPTQIYRTTPPPPVFPTGSAPIGGGPAASAAPATAGAATAGRRLSGGAIALIVLAGILLIALVVLVLMLLQRGGDPAPIASGSPSPSATPSESASPSATPSPTPTPTPTPTETAPPAPAPEFTIFQAENTANCPDDMSSVPLFWSWSIEGASTVWFGIGTDDARAEPFEEVPATATYEFAYQCSEESQLYTVSAENADGLITHRTVEVVRLLP